MRIQNKKYAWLAGAAGLLFILLLTLIIFASQVIDAKYVKEKIIAEVSRKFGAGFNFRSVDLSLFPVPRVLIRKAVFAYPEKADGTAETIKIYPHLLPLLCGNIRIAKIQIESPVFFFDVSVAGKPHAVEELLKEILQVLNAQLSEETGLVIVMKKGSVNLAGEGKKLLPVRDLESRIDFSSGKLQLSLNGSADFSKKFSIKGQMYQKGPSLSVDIEASDIDVLSVRNAAFSLFGDVPLVQDIFTYLRGGTVPVISFQSHGASVADLGKTENFTIKGKMREGEIFLPGSQLAFQGVKGAWGIAKGILTGEEITATLEHISLKKTGFSIGLRGKDAALHIETAAAFNVAELSYIVHRALKPETLDSGFNSRRQFKKDAEGRFVLDSSPGGLRFRLNGSADFSKKFSIRGEMHQKGRSRTDLNLGIEAGEIDVPQARDAAFSLFGDAPLVQDIFRIVKGGTVPSLSFQSHGASVADLGKDENMVIKGTMSEGEIFVSGPRLMFQGVRGEWGVAKGMLNAENITARLEHAVLKKGKLTIGLRGKDAPLHFETFAEFNVPELYRILQRAFKSEVLPKGLNLLQHVKGDAEGSLVLGESLDKLENVGFRGEIKTINGQDVPLDLVNNEKGFRINKLVITDAFSHATFTLNLQERIADLTFDGILQKKSLEALLDTSSFPEGVIQGRFSAHLNLERPMESSAQGNLKGEKVPVPWKKDLPLTLETISLTAAANRMTLQSAVIRIDDGLISLRGTFDFSAKGIRMDADAAAERLAWETVKKMFAKEDKRASGDISLLGSLRLQLNNFIYEGFTVSPLHAGITFSPDDNMAIAITRASVCGIAVPGEIKVSDDTILMDLKPLSRGEQLQPAFACVAKNRKTLITGVYDFDALLKAQGKGDSLLQSLSGKIDFSAKDGRIYQSVGLAKIFSVINVQGIFEGGLPDLVKEGFVYRSFVLKGDIEKGKIIVKEAVIDSPSMELVGEGTVDLVTKKIDMKVLAAPLKTVDVILRNIPLVKNIAGHNFISVPVTITGNLDDPQVSSLSPSSVGSGILGIMEKILKAPVHLFAPGDTGK